MRFNHRGVLLELFVVLAVAQAACAPPTSRKHVVKNNDAEIPDDEQKDAAIDEELDAEAMAEKEDAEEEEMMDAETTEKMDAQVKKDVAGTDTATTKMDAPAQVDTAPNVYAYQKTITIQRAKVPDNLTNFPMLFSVVDANLKSTANGGHVISASGFDIVFRASDGTTALSHETELYNPTTGQLVAWVRVPAVNGTAAGTDTGIQMHYGNGAVTTSTATGSAVWDTNFKAVYHLGQTTGGAGAIKDSTANANHLTDKGTPALGGAGFVGNSIQFDGVDDYLMGSPSASLQITQALTMSGWFRPDGTGTNQIGFGTTTDDVTYTAPYWDYVIHFPAVDNLTLTPRFRLMLEGSPNSAPITLANVNGGQWFHTVGTYDKANMIIYLEGTASPPSPFTAAITNHMKSLMVGGAAGATPAEAFKGMMDELRISNTARSAAWVTTEYNNQKSPSTFYSVSAETAR